VTCMNWSGQPRAIPLASASGATTQRRTLQHRVRGQTTITQRQWRMSGSPMGLVKWKDGRRHVDRTLAAMTRFHARYNGRPPKCGALATAEPGHSRPGSATTRGGATGQRSAWHMCETRPSASAQAVGMLTVATGRTAAPGVVHAF
jgi:hypothetical protein